MMRNNRIVCHVQPLWGCVCVLQIHYSTDMEPLRGFVTHNKDRY